MTLIGLLGGLAFFANLITRMPDKKEERKYLDLKSQYRVRHLERLRLQKKELLETHAVHMELMDLMKQIVVYSSNIAKTFLSTAEKLAHHHLAPAHSHAASISETIETPMASVR